MSQVHYDWSFAPNTSSGQSFVHDPNMSHTPEVKAQIKLSFSTRGKRKVFVSRKMVLKKKKDKLEFKQLEGALKVREKDPQQEVTQQTISGKCAELDTVIPEMIGVSKAILETVIFCHQEDSAWPLQESAVLKKKFDDIFESTRYSKALDEVKKQKKRLTEEARLANTQVQVLSVHRTQAKGLEKQLAECAEKLACIDQQVNELNEQRDEKTASVAVLVRNLEAVRGLKGQRVLAKSESKAHSKLYKDQDAKLRDSCGRYDKLIKMKSSQITAVLHEKKNSFEQHSKNLANNQLDAEDFQASISSLNQDIRNLEDQQITYQLSKKNIKEEEIKLLKKLRVLCLGHGLVSEAGDLDSHISAALGGGSSSNLERDRCVEDIVELMTKKGKDLESEYIALKNTMDNEMADRREKITSITSDIKVIASKMASNTASISKFELGIQKATMELEQADQLRKEPGNAQTMETQIRAKQAERESLESQMKESAERLASGDVRNQLVVIAAEIVSKEQEVASLENQQEALVILKSKVDNMLRDSLSCSKLITKCNGEFSNVLGSFSDLDPILEGVNDSMLAVSENIGQGFLDVDLSAYVERVEAASTASGQSTSAIVDLEKSIADKLRESQNKYRDFQDQKKNLTKEKEDTVRRITQLTERKDNLGVDLSEEEQTNNDVLETKFRKLEGSVSQMKMQVKLTKETTSKDGKHFCSTCTQELKDDWKPSGPLPKFFNESGLVLEGFTVEVNGVKEQYILNQKLKGKDFFVGRICGRIYLKINKLNALREALQKAQKKREAWFMNLPKIEEHKRLETELQELRASLTEIDVKTRSNSVDVKQELLVTGLLQDQLQKVSACCALVKSVSASCERVQEQALEALLYGEKLHIVDVFSNHSGDGPSVLELRRQDLKQIVQTQTNLHAQRDELTRKNNTLVSQFNGLQNEIIRMERDKFKMQESLVKQNELTKQVSESSIRVRELGRENRSLNNEKVAKEESLGTVENQMVEYQSTTGEEVAEKHNFKINFASELASFKSNHEMLTQKIQKLPDTDFSNDIAALNTRREQLIQSLNSVNEIINAGNKSAEHQQLEKNEYEQFLELAIMRTAGQQRKERIDELDAKIAALLPNESVEDTENLLKTESKKCQELENKISKRDGERSAVQSRWNEISEELQGKVYREIDDRLKVQAITQKSAELAAGDLDRYYKALDTALMQFHQMKIEEINKNIKSLWQMMYRGGDIDKIELTSDKSVSGRSRSYNYRVMMTKNGVPLDMRGRCSAGQKVLAALVIRMALAETFSANCGILTLDEPTTNLDHQNKVGFANALAEVLKRSKKQRRFQLIVITHDVEFVDLLEEQVRSAGQEASYYEVRRELDTVSNNFLSKISCRS